MGREQLAKILIIVRFTHCKLSKLGLHLSYKLFVWFFLMRTVVLFYKAKLSVLENTR